MRMTLQGEDTEENRDLLAELFRIEQYVDMVLSYIRLGSSQTDFVFAWYDLDSIIRQAIHKYASQFVRRRIRLVYEPVEVQVLTDEKWLLFILEQLLSNAIKYTPQGTVTITVSPEKILTVSDTGIGIAPEDLPRIFEKGFTGYNGRADKKATGLGLYLCRQTADILGIRVSAQSEPGRGSTFSLDLQPYKNVT
jgi:signal transduction histidine kinase